MNWERATTDQLKAEDLLRVLNNDISFNHKGFSSLESFLPVRDAHGRKARVLHYGFDADMTPADRF